MALPRGTGTGADRRSTYHVRTALEGSGQWEHLAYAQLVGTGLQQGVFDYYNFATTNGRNAATQLEVWKAQEEADAKLLISLKDERRQAKHDGPGDADAWLRTHYWSIARILEGLANKARHPPDDRGRGPVR